MQPRVAAAQIRMLFSFRTTKPFAFFAPPFQPPAVSPQRRCSIRGPRNVLRYRADRRFPARRGGSGVPRIIVELSMTHVRKNAYAIRV